MRTIETHKVNGANDKLVIEVLDEPGSGGASHAYRIYGMRYSTNKSLDAVYMTPAVNDTDTMTLLFQNGPIAEAGVNGITHEALIAVLIDRLESFQGGPFQCAENRNALDALRRARAYLNERTERRIVQGVEGTHQPDLPNGGRIP